MSDYNGAPWTIPDLVSNPARADAAAQVLSGYFAVNAEARPRFSGSQFERFAGGGDTTANADSITADDILAVSLLSVHIPGDAVLRILGDLAPKISALLKDIPVGVDLVNATDDDLDVAEQLWTVLRSLNNIGRTKASKLLARKRPRMLPVIDSVVVRTLVHDRRRTDFYKSLRRELSTDNAVLHEHLQTIRQKSGIGDDISVIRCFDILVWMVGTDRAEPILG